MPHGDPNQAAFEVELHLRRFLRHRVRNLCVEWRDEGVILRGRARSYFDKQAAQELVLGLPDCPLDANEITV